MSLRASSSHAETPPRRWYREPWPWLLMAGPFAVVVASLASAWIAVNSDDGVVAEDYYKQGLLINRRLAQSGPDTTAERGATIAIDALGGVRVHLNGVSQPPRSLRLTIASPDRRRGQTVVVEAGSDGDYRGVLGAQRPGRWIVTLEADAWRLPVTTIAGRLSEIRLGSAAGRS